jgi:hypothetical protein
MFSLVFANSVFNSELWAEITWLKVVASSKLLPPRNVINVLYVDVSKLISHFDVLEFVVCNRIRAENWSRTKAS